MTSNTASPVSAINHIALMTGELDRLADFYATIFGAQILARSARTPRASASSGSPPPPSLHLFEVGPERAPAGLTTTPSTRDRSTTSACSRPAIPENSSASGPALIQAGRTDETVYDATDLYARSSPPTPTELFIELILRKVTTGWDPPFATKPFRGLGAACRSERLIPAHPLLRTTNLLGHRPPHHHHRHARSWPVGKYRWALQKSLRRRQSV